MKTKFIKYLDGEFQIESIDDIISSAQLSSVEDIYKIHCEYSWSKHSAVSATVILKEYPFDLIWRTTGIFSVEYDKRPGIILYLIR